MQPATEPVVFPEEPHICLVTESAPGFGYRPGMDDVEFRFRIWCTVCTFCSIAASEEQAYDGADGHYDAELHRAERRLFAAKELVA